MNPPDRIYLYQTPSGELVSEWDVVGGTPRDIEYVRSQTGSGLSQVVEWIPVEERLPPIGRTVQVAFSDERTGFAHFDDGRHHADKKPRWWTPGNRREATPTHWAEPLKPPQQCAADPHPIITHALGEFSQEVLESLQAERDELVAALGDCASLFEELDTVTWFPESDFKSSNYSELQNRVIEVIAKHSK